MAEQCFPYNSVGGDRKYKAEEFRAYFAQLIGNGVIYKSADALKVYEGDGMSITVKAGGACIEGAGYINGTDLTLTLDTADGSLSRIDRIVIRNDYTNRKTYAAIIKGAYSAKPTAPTLTRNADAYEIAIADILVAGGVVSITQAAITDTRLNNSLCGIVSGVIEQADTTELYNQFESYFNDFKAQYIADMESWTQEEQDNYSAWETEQKADFIAWVESIKDILDATAAGKLQNEIEQQAADVFNRYYGLVTQSTEFKDDGSIVAENEEATVTTTFNTDKENGKKTVTETIVTKSGKTYVKTTTTTPATETTNKIIREEYTTK